jgi:hypothetical protein
MIQIIHSWRGFEIQVEGVTIHVVSSVEIALACLKFFERTPVGFA